MNRQRSAEAGRMARMVVPGPPLATSLEFVLTNRREQTTSSPLESALTKNRGRGLSFPWSDSSRR